MRIFYSSKDKAWFRNAKRLVKQLVGIEVWYSPSLNLDTRRHGDWCFLPDNINENSIIYSLGVGEDIIFDTEIIKEFNAKVEAFDPTPNSIEWLKSKDLSDNFNFHPFGISNTDGVLNLYPLVLNGKKSSSMYTLNEDSSATKDAVEIPVKRLPTIMSELGHNKIDILKMDIEGAEYDVINDLLDADIEVAQLLVEFHHRFKSIGKHKTIQVVDRLKKAGYKIFFISEKGREYSFIKS